MTVAGNEKPIDLDSICTMLFIDNSYVTADLEELCWVYSVSSLLMLPVNSSSCQNQCKEREEEWSNFI